MGEEGGQGATGGIHVGVIVGQLLAVLDAVFEILIRVFFGDE